jgi:phage gp29-like protein
MTLPIITPGANSNASQYNHALSSAYMMWGKLNNPDYALARDPEIWAKCQRDSTICQAVSTRLHMIAARDWACEGGGGPAASESDKSAASVMDEILRNIRGFAEARLQLASACFRARSYAYIEGREETRNFGDGKPRRWWVPNRLRDIDPRRISYDSEPYIDDDGIKRLRVHQEMWSVTRGAPGRLTSDDLASMVKLVYKSEESNLGYGQGLLSAVYFLWWCKGIVWREGLQGLERWSQGVLVGKVGADREGSTGKTNEAIRDELFEAMRDARSRNIIVMGENESIEVHDGGGPGHTMTMEFLRYCDEKLLGLILGSVLPFGGAETTGSYARAEIEQSTSNALIRFDIDKLDESLTEDLLGLVWRQNNRNFQELGLGSAAMPIFRTSIAEREDTAEAASMVATLAGLGLPLKLSEVYRRTGFSEPAEEDGVLKVEPAAPVAPGGFPFSAEGGELGK